MARIGIDIDGVCYDFIKALRLYVNKTTNKPLEEMPPPKSWHFFREQWNISDDDYFKFVVNGVIDREIFWIGDIYPGCKESIDLIKNMGHEIVFITARRFNGIEHLCQQATFEWINNSGLPYDKIIVDNDKTGYSLDLLIDDSPNQIENHILHGEHAAIFDQPWNKEIQYCDRVFGWADAVNYVEKHFKKVLI